MSNKSTSRNRHKHIFIPNTMNGWTLLWIAFAITCLLTLFTLLPIQMHESVHSESKAQEQTHVAQPQSLEPQEQSLEPPQEPQPQQEPPQELEVPEDLPPFRVKAIQRNDGQPSTAGTSAVEFLVHFTRAVTGASAADFSMRSSDIKSATITQVTEVKELDDSIFSVVVTVSGILVNGFITLDVLANQTLRTLDAEPEIELDVGRLGVQGFNMLVEFPVMNRIISLSGNQKDPLTFSGSIDFVITSSVPLTGDFITGDFSVVTTGATTHTTLVVANSGEVNHKLQTRIAVSGIAGEGSIQLVYVHALSVLADEVDNLMQAGESVSSVAVDIKPPVDTAYGGLGADTLFVTKISPLVYVPSPESLVAQVFFNHPIIDTTPQNADLKLTFTGSATCTIDTIVVSVDKLSMTVTLHQLMGTGTIHLGVFGNLFIRAMVTANQVYRDFVIGSRFHLNNDPPIVTRIERVTETPTSGSQIDFVVVFSRPVQSVASTNFVMNSGSVATVGNVYSTVTFQDAEQTRAEVSLRNVSAAAVDEKEDEVWIEFQNPGTIVSVFNSIAMTQLFTGQVPRCRVVHGPPLLSTFMVVDTRSEAEADAGHHRRVVYNAVVPALELNFHLHTSRTISPLSLSALAGQMSVVHSGGGGSGGAVLDILELENSAGRTYVVRVGSFTGGVSVNETVYLVLNLGTPVLDTLGVAFEPSAELLGVDPLLVDSEVVLLNPGPYVLGIDRDDDPFNNLTSCDYTVRFSIPVQGLLVGDFVLATTDPDLTFINAATIQNPVMAGDSLSAMVEVTGLLDTGSFYLEYDLSNTVGGIGMSQAITLNSPVLDSPTYAVDRTSLTFISIRRLDPLHIYVDATVSFQMILSKKVVGVTSANFNITTTGGGDGGSGATASINNIEQTQDTTQIEVSVLVGTPPLTNGTARCTYVHIPATIFDLYGNALVSPGAGQLDEYFITP